LRPLHLAGLSEERTNMNHTDVGFGVFRAKAVSLLALAAAVLFAAAPTFARPQNGAAGQSSARNATTAVGKKLDPAQILQLIASNQLKGRARPSPKISNSHSTRKMLTGNTINLLKSQKSAADAERAEILSHVTLAGGGQGLSNQPMHTQGATVDPASGGGGSSSGSPPGTPGVPPTGSNPAGSNPTGSNPAGGGGSNSVGMAGHNPPTNVNPGGKGPTPSRIAMAPRPMAIAPVRTATNNTPPPAPSTNNRFSHAAAPLSNALACTHGTVISTINGKPSGVVFTPDPQYDLYTIKGCNFGDTQGEAHLYGPFASGQVKMQIEFWSDSQIVAKVDPQISGELDQDNVTLVISPSGKPQIQKPGCKFYAARESHLLQRIPQSAINFQTVTDSAGGSISFAGKTLQLEVPAKGDLYAGFAGMSIGVFRSDPNVFPGGQDYYDFSKMAPGFVADNMQFQSYTMGNDNCDTYLVGGNWDAEWDGDNIRVSWQQQHCHTSPYVFVSGMDLSVSEYALSVWVTGPRGVDPWPKNLQ
jgi:hypothetical protein